MTNSDVKPDWRILKLEQKAYLNAEFAAEKQVKTCGVFYLVDANLHVHICSLTPNLEAWPIQGYATFETEEAAERDEGELERELLDTEEGCSYLGTEVLVTCLHEALWRADAGLGDGCVAPDDWYDEAEPKTLTDEQFAALQALRKRLPEGFEAAPLYIYPERAYRAATEDDDPGDVDSDGEVRIPDSERERQLVAVVTWQRCDCDVRVVLPLES